METRGRSVRQSLMMGSQTALSVQFRWTVPLMPGPHSKATLWPAAVRGHS